MELLEASQRLQLASVVLSQTERRWQYIRYGCRLWLMAVIKVERFGKVSDV